MSRQVHFDMLQTSARVRGQAKRFTRQNQEREFPDRPCRLVYTEGPEKCTQIDVKKRDVTKRGCLVQAATDSNKHEPSSGLERRHVYKSQPEPTNHKFPTNTLPLYDQGSPGQDKTLSFIDLESSYIEPHQQPKTKPVTQAVKVGLEKSIKQFDEEWQDQHPCLDLIEIGSSFADTHEESRARAFEIEGENIENSSAIRRSRGSAVLSLWLQDTTEMGSSRAQGIFHEVPRVALAKQLAIDQASWQEVHRCLFPYLPLPDIDDFEILISRELSFLREDIVIVEYSKWATKEHLSGALFHIFCLSALAVCSDLPRPESTRLVRDASQDRSWKLASFIAQYHNVQMLKISASDLLGHLKQKRYGHGLPSMAASSTFPLRFMNQPSNRTMDKYMEILEFVSDHKRIGEDCRGETSSVYTFSSWLHDMTPNGTVIDYDVMQTSSD